MSDDEHELLEQLADPIVAAGMRLATPEETQALVDQAVLHVREQDELIAATPIARTVEGVPEIPRGNTPAGSLLIMADQIARMIEDVTDPSVAYEGNQDGYGKCVEAMWRAAYLAMGVVSRELGVTGFQHEIASMEALRHIRGIEGPFMILDLGNALYPQYDLRSRVEEALDDARPWLARRAAEFLAADTPAHRDVLAHWRKLAATGEGSDP